MKNDRDKWTIRRDELAADLLQTVEAKDKLEATMDDRLLKGDDPSALIDKYERLTARAKALERTLDVADVRIKEYAKHEAREAVKAGDKQAKINAVKADKVIGKAIPLMAKLAAVRGDLETIIMETQRLPGQGATGRYTGLMCAFYGAMEEGQSQWERALKRQEYYQKVYPRG
jgi:hypothetical protein